MSDKTSHICVIGDSFAAHRSNADSKEFNSKEWSWVNLVESELCYSMSGKSFAGQSFWHQRRWLLRELVKPNSFKDKSNTILIICHTEAQRLPVKHNDWSITGHIVTANKQDPHSNEIFQVDPTGSLFDLVKAFYLSELFVTEFYDNCFYSWLNELPELTRKFKKVIHFFGFENRMNFLPNNVTRFYLDKLIAPNAVVVKTLLMSLSLAERGNKHTWGGPDIGPNRANHFNPHNNRQMFEEIKHIIDHVPGGSYHEMSLENWDLRTTEFVTLLQPHRLDYDPNNDSLS